MLLFIRKAVWSCVAQLILLFCGPLASHAAARAAGGALVGQVCNKANKPLPGVVIALQGTGAVVITNAAGEFLVTSDAALPVLEFTYAGYQPQTFRVRTKGPIKVTLYEIGTALLPPPDGLEMVFEAVEAVDVEPAFPGGATAYQAYLRQNMHYPEAALARGISGTVLVGFTVDEQGRILNAQVAKGYAGLNEEALRLVNLMPWWTPARRQGKPVRAASCMRIRFELRAE